MQIEAVVDPEAGIAARAVAVPRHAQRVARRAHRRRVRAAETSNRRRRQQRTVEHFNVVVLAVRMRFDGDRLPVELSMTMHTRARKYSETPYRVLQVMPIVQQECMLS